MQSKSLKKLFLLTTLWFGLFLVVSSISLNFFNFGQKEKAFAATSSTINFQARLLNSAGALVPDGFYNVKFNLYSASSGGSTQWTEEYYDSNGGSPGNDNRVRVVNGYLSVYLGSLTSFPNTINWDQEQWLTINIGGTTQTATPTYDGEMSPRLKLSAVPYALTAGSLQKTSGANEMKITTATPTADVTYTFQDAAAGSYNVCTTATVCSGYAAASGSGSYIQNGTTPQTADFNITGTGVIGTSLTTPSILSTAALSIQAGSTLSLQSTTSSSVTLDSGTTGAINIGTNANAKTITIGNGTGATSVVINSGTGAINIGTNAVARTTTIGNNTGASSVVVDCGTGACSFGATATAHSTTVGSSNSTSATTIQSGTGNLSLQTQGTGTLGVGNNAVAQNLAIGNVTGATGITERVGTGNYSLDGVTNSTYAIGASTTTGTITIGGTAQTGNLTLGSSSGTNSVLIGNGAGATTVNIANANTAGAVNIGSAFTTGTISIGGTGAQTGTISLGTGTGAQSINLGTGGTAAKTVTLGSTASTSSTLIQSGTGNLSLQTQGTGTLGVGNNAVAQNLAIGNITGATGITERVGTGNYSLDGVTNSTYAIGASTTTGTITIGGTAQTGNLTLGSSSGTNSVLIGNGAGATTVNIANANTAGAVNIGAAFTTGTITIGGTGAQTGTISLGTGTGAQSINLGTGGTAAKTVTLGSTASTSTTTIQAGSGGISLNNATIATNAATLALFNTTATTINFGGGASTAINIGPASTTATSINLAGGSGDTGCTVAGATGNLTCSGAISTIATTGTQGWWTRTGSSLSPVNSGDAITTSGNISTSGSGTITSAGLLTGNAGATIAGSTINLNVNSNNTTNINTGTSTGAVNIGDTSTGTVTIQSGGTGSGTSLATGGKITLTQGGNYYPAGDAIIQGGTESPFYGSNPGAKITVQGASQNAGSGIVFQLGQQSGGGTGQLFQFTDSSSNTLAQINLSGQLQLPTSGSNAGIKIGGDTQIYRASAGSLVLKPTSSNDSTSAFQLQTAAGTAYLTGDSTNKRINIVGDLNVGTRYDSRLFSDTFESGGLGLWDGNTGTISASTTTVHDGKYSVQINPSSSTGYAWTYFPDNTTAYARAWVYVSSQTSASANLLTLEYSADTSSTSFTVFRDSGNLKLWNEGTSSSINSGTALSTGAWHLIEMRITTGNPTGVSQVWLDGTQVINVSSQNNSTNPLDTILIGDNSGGRTFTAYIDDVAADTVTTGTASSLSVDDSLHVGGTGSFGNDIMINVTDNDKAQLRLFESNDRGFNLFYDAGANQFVLQANDAGGLTNALTIDRVSSAATFDITDGEQGAHTFSIMDGTGGYVIDTNSSTDNVGIATAAASDAKLYALSGSYTVIRAKGTGTNNLLELQNNTNTVLQASNAGNITAGGSATGTTRTTEATNRNSVTTVTLTSAGFANNDVIRLVRSGTYYYTRIVSGGGTTSLTVSPAVSYDASSTVEKYNVQYLGNDGSTFTGTTRSNNSYFQGYFTGGVVTGTGSTIYSDANISSTNDLKIQAANSVTIQNSSNSTTTFQVQNASSGQLLNVDSTNSNITLLGNLSGEVQAWQTNANALPAARYAASSVTANGYVYAVGGVINSTVYYAKLNADGSVGTWSTNSNALPANRYGAGVVTANGYIYVIGGSGLTAGTTTVYYAKLNADGSVGTWSTNSNALPAARVGLTSIVSNGYVYAIGGGATITTGTETSTVYYAKLNADGSVGTWSTNSNALPAERYAHSSVSANGYVYVMGGRNISGTTQSTVYYAALNSDGSVGTWSTAANSMPGVRTFPASVVSNGYVYAIGGQDGTPTTQSTVYYSKLNNDGTVGTWSTAVNNLPDLRWAPASVTSNGYIYIIGGNDGSVAKSTVYYASTPRVQVGASLDLVGLQAGNLADGNTAGRGSVGGSLIAGDTNIIGTLQVQGNTNFSQSLNVNNNLNVGGTALFKNASNSTSAFQIKNPGGTNLFTADTTNNTISVAGGVASGSGGSAGGTGSGTSGDAGGGGGGAIGGVNAASPVGGTGATGAQSVDVSGLFSVLSGLGVPTTSPGAGGSNSSPYCNPRDGGNATGFGSGGGGAGYYGGNGGSGLYGGGGGGASGGSGCSSYSGGAGGAGVVVVNPTGGTNQLLNSGSSYTVGAGVTTIKVWVVGAGGGGAGVPTGDSFSGGAGGAGGVAYRTFSVSPGQTITYSLGTGGTGGTGANNGSDGGNTTVTVGSVTVTANGGSGGQYNNSNTGSGGSYSLGTGDIPFKIQDASASTTLLSADITNLQVTVSGNLDASSFSVSGTAGADITCAAGTVLQAATVSKGIVTGGSCASASYARAYNSSNTSLTTATWTTLTFNSETEDTDTYHNTSSNTSRLTASTAGWYNVTAQVTFAGNATGTRAVRVIKNGSTSNIMGESVVAPVATGGVDPTEIPVNLQLFLNANDYIEMQAYQASGGNLNVIALAAANTNPDTYFAISRIGAITGAGITIGTIDSQTKSSNGAVISGSSLYLQTADASNPGLVSTGTQTFAGAKTFSSLITGSAGATISGATTSINASSNFATNINTGTSTGAVSIGNTTAAETVTIQGGNTSTAISIQSAASGTIAIGTANAANTIQLGNTANAVAQTFNIGNNATASSSSTVNIGSTIGTSPTTIQGGSSGITLGSTGAVNVKTTGFNIQDSSGTNMWQFGTTHPATLICGQTGNNDCTIQAGSSLTLTGGNTAKAQIGSSTTDANIFYLVLDSYNNSTDPSGPTNGGMYYNTATSKFRCYQGSAWKDCVSPWIQITKSADQDVTNSATFANDSALQFSVTAGVTYTVRFNICYAGNTTAGDYKGQFLFPAAIAAKNVSGRYVTTTTGDLIQTSSGILGNTTSFPATTSMGTAAAFTDKRIFEGAFTFQPNSSGTMNYQFAQNTATVSTSARTCANSFIEYQAL